MQYTSIVSKVVDTAFKSRHGIKHRQQIIKYPNITTAQKKVNDNTIVLWTYIERYKTYMKLGQRKQEGHWPTERVDKDRKTA